MMQREQMGCQVSSTDTARLLKFTFLKCANMLWKTILFGTYVFDGQPASQNWIRPLGFLKGPPILFKLYTYISLLSALFFSWSSLIKLRASSSNVSKCTYELCYQARNEMQITVMNFVKFVKSFLQLHSCFSSRQKSQTFRWCLFNVRCTISQ